MRGGEMADNDDDRQDAGGDVDFDLLDVQNRGTDLSETETKITPPGGSAGKE